MLNFGIGGGPVMNNIATLRKGVLVPPAGYAFVVNSQGQYYVNHSGQFYVVDQSGQFYIVEMSNG
jgi:cytochrome oxidase Cu insertion factor (SCO1/SenC/PrrC family)